MSMLSFVKNNYNSNKLGKAVGSNSPIGFQNTRNKQIELDKMCL